MRIICIIPARMGSTRLENKLMRRVGDQTILGMVYKSCSLVDDFSDVIIATDSIEIKGQMEALGAHVSMTRSDHPSGTDRIIEVASSLDSYDYIVNVQGDEALISPEHLTTLLTHLKEQLPDICTAYSKNRSLDDFQDPNKVKLVRTGHRVLYFSRAAIPWDRETPSGFSGSFDHHAGIYAFSKDSIARIAELEPSTLEMKERLEQLRWMEAGLHIDAVEIPGGLFGIDTEDDLERLRQMNG